MAIRGTVGQGIVSTDDETPEDDSADGESTATGRSGPVTKNGETSSADEARSVEEASTDAMKQRPRRSISVSVRGLSVAVLVAVLTAVAATFAWLYVGARNQLEMQASDAASNSRAEIMSLDYAVKAATMDFKDLQTWKVKLVEGTSPELNDKLSEAGKSMEQILVPLEWSSTAQPLVAKVRSSAAGIYVVDCFVSVQTKTIQASEPLQSTATYSITLDSSKNWQITDVGGIGSVVGAK